MQENAHFLTKINPNKYQFASYLTGLITKVKS